MLSNIRTLSRKIPLVALAAAAALLSACLFDEDDTQTVDVRYKGLLSTLDSVPDTTSTAKRWHLVVDAAEPHELRGDCEYTAWLGDSTGVEAEDTEDLYTNTQMGNRTLPAEQIRQQGVDFYLYPDHGEERVLTHYRVDFECRY
jgi:hypothetical protein